MLKRPLLVLSAVVALALPSLPALAVPNPSADNTPNPPDTGAHVIRDPGEYDAFINALNITDPVRKAAALEAFILSYPNSSIKVDALEQAMGAYQQAGNTTKVEDAANRLLAIDHNNVHALATITRLRRAEAAKGNTQALAELQTDAGRGLVALPGWPKPQGVSSTDFGRQRDQFTAIFEGGLGFVAFAGKDYPGARGHYLKSVHADPSNAQDVYQLAVAQLQLDPIDTTGFWYMAKAWNLAGAQKNFAAQQTIETYAKAKYFSYHGSAEGWDAILENARINSAPPANFSVTPAH